ncbi:MAG: biotin--[acetyl-CoA-carboxylase] ligase [Aerococcus sp.]|nr:biotin--[acetyl-CoA-carboxylase] ligase [Aerococcus sp.]
MAQGESSVIVIADQQTKGRGRMGHSFYSPDSGIYLTIGFLIHNGLSTSTDLTVRAAVAALLTIDRLIGQPAARIKWVNDLYLNNHKVAGILTQIEPNHRTASDWNVALGIGINLAAPADGFPEEIQSKAGAVFDYPVADAVKTESILLLLQMLSQWLSLNEKAHADVLHVYRERQLLNNKVVTYQHGGQTCTGIVLGIDEQFHLVVRSSSGDRHTLDSGEVHILNWQ